MISRMALVAVVALMFALSGCKSKAEKAMDDMVSTIEDVANRLAQIKTHQDLVDATNDLKVLGARMKDRGKAMSEVEGALSEEEREKIKIKYIPRVEKGVNELMAQMERISNALGADAMTQIGAMINLPGSDW